MDSLLGVHDIRQLAAQLDINPTKKLGQNFMIDPGVIRRIVAAAGIEPGDNVLEIGPGLGSLTLGLLQADAYVTTVEIDQRLAQQLPLTVAARDPHAAEQLKVIHADGLKVTPQMLEEQGFIATQSAHATPSMPSKPFHLVANLPYNVATPILLTLLERFDNLQSALVLVQKEVANRLSASPGSKIYGSPSVKLAWYGTARTAGAVSRSVFWPVPNVDSQLVSFTRSTAVSPEHGERLRTLTFQLIDTAFAQRRKTLRAALGKLATSEQIAQAGIDPSARGETLTVGDFTELAKTLLADISESQEASQVSSSTSLSISSSPAPAPAHSQRTSEGCTVTIPAKTNLYLRVGEAELHGERTMHKMETIYCSVGVSDVVSVKLKPEGTGFSLDINGSHLGDLGGENGSTTDLQDNLATRALFAIANEARKSTDVSISIEKNIPVAAGLGGGSADAAAVLIALNRLWKLDYPLEKLRSIGARLGADVPFCITGGLAMGTNYGEVVTDLSPKLRERIMDSEVLSHMILGVFNSGVSTANVYSQVTEPQPLHSQTQLSDLDFNPEHIVNDLEQPCLQIFPRAQIALSAAQQTVENPHNREVNGADPVPVFISGSGPTIVACSKNRAALNQIAYAWAKNKLVDRILAVNAADELPQITENSTIQQRTPTK